jgi:hypothetical protein
MEAFFWLGRAATTRGRPRRPVGDGVITTRRKRLLFHGTMLITRGLLSCCPLSIRACVGVYSYPDYEQHCAKFKDGHRPIRPEQAFVVPRLVLRTV